MGLSIIIVMFLAACGSNVDEGTSDQYISLAKDVVTLLNEGKYKEVHDQLNEDMKAGLPLEALKESKSIFDQSGDFEKINKSSVEEKDDYYIVVLAANYSEENRIFTISFNEQEEIVGLYIK